MNTINTIMKRSSYRGSYKDIPVPREDLKTILAAGLAAPSGCNKQTTSLIAVDDREILLQFTEFLTKKNFRTAPAIICVLTEKIYVNDHKTYYVQDYAAAVENMLLAITALGYESCWVEGQIIDNSDKGELMAKILKVPENYQLVVALPVGIADEDVESAVKKPYEHRAWFNGFGQTAK